MRLRELKASIYLFLTICGIALIFCGVHFSNGRTITDLLQSLTFFASGIGLVLFGIATYALRYDRDIWS
jgi:hypothetical membrane protein